MIALEEARQVAARRLDDICGCNEFTTAYVFYNPRSELSIGGWDAPVAVLKKNGRCCGFTEFISDRGGGEMIRTIEL